MLKLFPLLLLLIGLSTDTVAQTPLSGNCALSSQEDEKLMERLRQNKITAQQMTASIQTQQVSYIPVTFHVVRRSTGDGGVRWVDFVNQVCALNEYYARQNTNLQFFIKDIQVILSDAAYFEHFKEPGASILLEEKQEKCINIFIVGMAETNSNVNGVTLGYYSPVNDWIVIRRDEFNDKTETLFHEIGHFFSLPHPFRGWDFDPYDAADHGVAVGEYAPSTGFPNQIRNEWQDGSNCETAGDEICDTAPDYNFAKFNWECNYTGGAKDPSGTLINPDEKNIMSYFISCPAKSFSTQQKALMGADLFNRILEETLVFGSGPGSGTLSVPQLQQPVDWGNQPDFSSLTFSWTAVANADRYVLQFDDSPSFAFGTLQLLSEGNSITVEEDYFEAAKLYYWRVRPFNGYQTCTEWSGNFHFFTNYPTATKNLSPSNSLRVFPNPLGQGQSLSLSYEGTQSGQAMLRVYAMDGKELLSPVVWPISAGENFYTLPTASLKSGLYFITLQTQNGRTQKRFLIE